jgi:hypothetical protein
MPVTDWRSWRWASLVTVVVSILLLGAFASSAGAAIPSGGRAWEMVTPAKPTSARTFAVLPMTEDDEKFGYTMLGPAPGSESGPFSSFVIAERGQTGWTNRNVSVPYSIEESEVLAELVPIMAGAFSEDFGTVLWLSTAPLAAGAPPEGQVGLYRRVGNGPFEFVAKTGDQLLLFGFAGFADMASDGSRVVFTAREHLLPGDAGRTSGRSIYAWNGSSLSLVDVDNGGNLLSTCGTQLSKENGMSASAKLVFFTVPAECGGVEKVYLRNLEDNTTVQVSASQCTRVDCNAADNVYFMGAVRDGSVAFLMSKQQLTNEDHDAGFDVYRYDVSSEELSLLSGGAETTGEAVWGPVQFSDHGERVYFRGTGEVLPGEVTTGEKLFLADSSGVHLVAHASFPAKPEIQLSANGTRAVFVTQSQLLPSDTDSEADAYLYDATQETLTRITTGTSGGNGPFGVIISSPVERPEFQSTGDYEPFYAIDGNGERVFFSTREQLLPEDTNTKADIYEWWNGQLGLITPGNDEYDSVFSGISRDGRSVLFATNASLLPADKDGGNRDFYMARIGGGFPEPEEEAPGCEEIAQCPPPLRKPPPRPTPASASQTPQKSGHIRVIRVRSTAEGVVGRSTTVLVAAPSPGPVSASVWVHIHGKNVVVAAGSARAKRPGNVRIDVRLTQSGRQSSAAQIRKGHLTVRQGDSVVTQVVKLNLG